MADQFRVIDTASKWPYAANLTADFVFSRLHGAEKLCVSGYSDQELHWWANLIKFWQHGKQPPDRQID